MFLDETPKGLPRVTFPDVWFIYRTNPAISFWDTEALGGKMARFPFTVAFAYTHDETNHHADVLLPEATDLESLQLIRIGGSKFVEQFWERRGFALRQPPSPPRRATAATPPARATHGPARNTAAINRRGRRALKARTGAPRGPGCARPPGHRDAVCRAAAPSSPTAGNPDRVVEGERARDDLSRAGGACCGAAEAPASNCRTRSACSASASSSAVGCTSTT
jgi:hypothetical protein